MLVTPSPACAGKVGVLSVISRQQAVMKSGSIPALAAKRVSGFGLRVKAANIVAAHGGEAQAESSKFHSARVCLRSPFGHPDLCYAISAPTRPPPKLIPS